MKKLFLLPVLLWMTVWSSQGQNTDATIPVVTISTPSLNVYTDLIIIGTATDTAATGRTAGVREVFYQVEGSQKWRKARLTSKNRTPTTWIVDFRNKSSVGKRIIFYAVDNEGRKSDVVGRHFKRSTGGTVAVTPDPEEPAN